MLGLFFTLRLGLQFLSPCRVELRGHWHLSVFLNTSEAEPKYEGTLCDTYSKCTLHNHLSFSHQQTKAREEALQWHLASHQIGHCGAK